MTTFRWTDERRDAALDVAEDRLSDHEIAAKAGVSRAAFAKWKLSPLFQVEVAKHQAALHEKVQRRGIAEKQNRVDLLNALLADLQTVKRERAAKYGSLAGGTTGLIVAEPLLVKVYGELDEKGRFQPLGQSELIEVEKFDAGFFRELRATIKQGKDEDGDVDDIDVTEMSDEDLDAFVRRKSKRRS